jgi:hypothetical protein
MAWPGWRCRTVTPFDNHGERFTKLMDGFMSDWRARRDQLNESPLRHEE